jgi:hypothetical protein
LGLHKKLVDLVHQILPDSKAREKYIQDQFVPFLIVTIHSLVTELNAELIMFDKPKKSLIVVGNDGTLALVVVIVIGKVLKKKQLHFLQKIHHRYFYKFVELVGMYLESMQLKSVLVN